MIGMLVAASSSIGVPAITDRVASWLRIQRSDTHSWQALSSMVADAVSAEQCLYRGIAESLAASSRMDTSGALSLYSLLVDVRERLNRPDLVDLPRQYPDPSVLAIENGPTEIYESDTEYANRLAL